MLAHVTRPLLSNATAAAQTSSNGITPPSFQPVSRYQPHHHPTCYSIHRTHKHFQSAFYSHFAVIVARSISTYRPLFYSSYKRVLARKSLSRSLRLLIALTLFATPSFCRLFAFTYIVYIDRRYRHKCIGSAS